MFCGCSLYSFSTSKKNLDGGRDKPRSIHARHKWLHPEYSGKGPFLGNLHPPKASWGRRLACMETRNREHHHVRWPSIWSLWFWEPPVSSFAPPLRLSRP